MSTAIKQILSLTKHKQPLELYYIPLATQLKSQNLRLNYYTIYPSTKTTLSPLKSTISTILNLWKNGLFVISRIYKKLFKGIRNDKIDEVVWKYSSSSEEDLLKLVNISFNKVPITRVDLIYPEKLEQGFNSREVYVGPFQLPSQNLQDLESPNLSNQLDATLYHLSSLDEYFNQLYLKSKKSLFITIPSYLFFYINLKYFTFPFETFIETFTNEILSIVGFPVAYNLIKVFSYSRCVESCKLLKKIVNTDKNIVEDEIKKLRESENESVREQIDVLEEYLESVGVFHVNNENYSINRSIDSSTSDEVKLVKFEKVKELVGDDVGLAQFYSYFVKSQDKLMLRLRLLEKEREKEEKEGVK